MKKVLIATLTIAALSMGISELFGQQLPQFTQYMFNDYMINPAVAGTHNYYQIRMNNRYQWVGVPDAPLTNTLSVYGPHGSKDMGFGGYLFSDITGPTSRMGALFTYAYNLQIHDNGMRLSVGISLGGLMFRADASKFDYAENFDMNDPALFTGTKTKFTPDASIGVLCYTTQYFFGASVHQLFGQRLYRTILPREAYQDTIYGINKLRQHYMLSGGVFLMLNRDYDIEPSVLFKYMINAPVQIDLNAKVTYRKQFWGGLSLRWQDGISVLLGYNYDQKYMFGYSFDFSLTEIRKHNAGSHEIMIGVLFDKLK